MSLRNGTGSVCVIVLNWNNWADTIECLESLMRVTYPNYTVAVVDNGSTDGSVDCIKLWAEGKLDVCVAQTTSLRHLFFPPAQKPIAYVELNSECDGQTGTERLVIISVGENLGFTGGTNVGLRHVLRNGFEYAVLMNNDVVVDARFLSALVRCAEEASDRGVVGGKIFSYEKPNELQSVGNVVDLARANVRSIGTGELDAGQYEQTQEFGYLGGACLLVKRQVLASVGMLDESFFMYSEDVDYCLRARRAGYRCVYTPGSRVWHKWEASSNPRFVRFMTSRNRIRLAHKHLSRRAFVGFIFRVLFFRSPRLILSYVWARKAELIGPYLAGLLLALLGKTELLYSTRKDS